MPHFFRKLLKKRRERKKAEAKSLDTITLCFLLLYRFLRLLILASSSLAICRWNFKANVLSWPIWLTEFPIFSLCDSASTRMSWTGRSLRINRHGNFGIPSHQTFHVSLFLSDDVVDSLLLLWLVELLRWICWTWIFFSFFLLCDCGVFGGYYCVSRPVFFFGVWMPLMNFSIFEVKAVIVDPCC